MPFELETVAFLDLVRAGEGAVTVGRVFFSFFFDLVRAGDGGTATAVLSATDWIAFFGFAAALFFPWMFSTCRFQLNSRVNFFPHSSQDQLLVVPDSSDDAVMFVITVVCNCGKEGGMESEEATSGMEDELSGKFSSMTEGKFVCIAEVVGMAFIVDLVEIDDVEMLGVLCPFCLLL